jgi:phosphoribosyl 1,2-cyclic phosphodiesterase
MADQPAIRSSSLSITCHGVRGSVPVSGPAHHRYGGATSCFEIPVGVDHRLLIDMGTGALKIATAPVAPTRFSVLLTHLHWDHTLALPFFRALYRADNWFDFYGYGAGGMDIEEALDRVIRPPWFPVNFRSTPAQKRFHTIETGAFNIADIIVSTERLHHPDGVTAYRLTRNGASMVMATDTEHGEPDSDARIRRLARGTDVLFYDAQYTPDQYLASKVGWGHSTWEQAVKIAEETGVRRLILTSHDPMRTDDEIDEILALARERFPNTDAAREGMVVEVG